MSQSPSSSRGWTLEETMFIATWFGNPINHSRYGGLPTFETHGTEERRGSLNVEIGKEMAKELGTRTVRTGGQVKSKIEHMTKSFLWARLRHVYCEIKGSQHSEDGKNFVLSACPYFFILAETCLDDIGTLSDAPDPPAGPVNATSSGPCNATTSPDPNPINAATSPDPNPNNAATSPGLAAARIATGSGAISSDLGTTSAATTAAPSIVVESSANTPDPIEEDYPVEQELVLQGVDDTFVAEVPLKKIQGIPPVIEYVVENKVDPTAIHGIAKIVKVVEREVSNRQRNLYRHIEEMERIKRRRVHPEQEKEDHH
ncbi:hypothetical protein BGX34_008774 [Mortierella sp. NVP85]|nr:hypothetical protein BGX34_008774 [Mortierella sp. NVP85]